MDSKKTTLQNTQSLANQAVGASTLVSKASTLLGLNDTLPVVRFEFHCHDGPPSTWQVHRLNFTENLSRPYELTLELVTEDTSIHIEELLGCSCELIMDRQKVAHSTYGIIRQVEFVGYTSHALLVRVYIVPAFALLKQRINSRIWQDKTVPQILEELLQESLAPYDRGYQLEAIKQSGRIYEVRDYCVQYNESDFDFISRLMEEEGIFYFFEQNLEQEREILTLLDDNGGFPELVAYDGTCELELINKDEERYSNESLQGFEWRCGLHSTSVLRNDFDWKNPEQLRSYELRQQDDKNREREIYEHGQRRRIENDEVEDRVKDKVEILNQALRLGFGHGNVIGFSPGFRFKLVRHNLADLEQEYFITQVTHTGYNPAAIIQSSQADQQRPNYQNTFKCIPNNTPFRPLPTTTKPRVYGPQTAIVTGPQNEEIHADEYGRIKVKFHWDRYHPADHTSSCWIRVAQNWAGLSWGGMVIPRVGMEVVVEFLEGNPDRPLVTGCVYNGKNMPPYDPSSDKTKSTFKTNSSPDGTGANELRFEDAKGGEEIYIHAQKDFNEVIENNHSTTVKANQSDSVSGKQTITVKKDQSITVDGKQENTVKKDQINIVESNQENKVTGTQTETIDQDRVLSIAGSDSVGVGGSRCVSIGSVTCPPDAGATYFIGVTGSMKTSVSTTYDLNVTASHTITAASSNIVAGSVGSIAIDPIGNVYLMTPGELMGTGGITSLTMNNAGAKILCGITEISSTPSEIKLSCGETSSITLTASEIKLSCAGSTITLNAAGITAETPALTKIKGNPVQIN